MATFFSNQLTGTFSAAPAPPVPMLAATPQNETLGGKKDAEPPLPGTEQMFSAFAAPKVDVFGNSIEPEAATEARGADHGRAMKVAEVYGSAVNHYSLPPVRSVEDAVNATIHAMAVQFFDGTHMKPLQSVLLSGSAGDQLPVHTAKDPATGQAFDMFLFDGAFLRALMRLVRGLVKPDGQSGSRGLREIVLFTCYAMHMRRMFTQLTGAYYMVDMAEKGQGALGDLGKQLPDLNDFANRATDKRAAQASLVKDMIGLAQGLWKWPDEDEEFRLVADVAKALTGAGVSAGAWCSEPAIAGTKDALQKKYADLFANDAWKTVAKDGCIPQAFAHAAYSADTITALYNHFMWVANAYTKAKKSQAKRADGGPATADVDFVQSGITGKSSQETVCAPGTAPMLAVGDAALYNAAAGKEGKQALAAGAPVSINDGTIRATGQLMPGVVVESCQPVRAMSDVVGGAKLATSIPGMMAPSGAPLNVQAQPIYRPLTSGGFPMVFGAQQMAPDVHSFAADSVMNVAAGSPLVQQYFTAFNTPPSFRAVVITPPSAR